MDFIKKRKLGVEWHAFQEKWRHCYFIVEQNGKPTCVICMQQMTPKEHTVQWHYELHHAAKYNKYIGKQRKEKVFELEQSLKRQQSTSDRANKAALKASYRIAHKIAASLKPLSEGKFVKECMLAVAKELCPGQLQAFQSICLSENTVAERISDLSGNLKSQLAEKATSFIAFSVAVDESRDVADLAQLAIFIRGVDDEMHVTEEFVEIVRVKDTATGDDVFRSIAGALDKLGVNWGKMVSLATNGAPQTVVEEAGVAAKFREMLLTANPQHQFFHFHCILHPEALCARTLKMDHVRSVVTKAVNFILSHGKSTGLLEEGLIGLCETEGGFWSEGLGNFYHLRHKVEAFMTMNGEAVPEFQDEEWLRDLAFVVDVTFHLNCLSKTLQGRNKAVTEFYDSICVFVLKLQLWEKQLQENNLMSFPTLRSLTSDRMSTEKYWRRVAELRNEFQERFSAFRNLDRDFEVFRNPFSVDVHEVPVEIQLEIIDLQFDYVLKNKFAEVSISKFYQLLGPNYPKIKASAAKILSMFGTTYVCQQLFSAMNANISNRSEVCSHLNSILKIATAQTLTPDFDAVIQSKSELTEMTCC